MKFFRIFKKSGSSNCIFFVFGVRIIRSHDTIASRQRNIVAGATTRARMRGDDVDDSHIRVGRVSPTDSHKRRMAIEQFRALLCIRRR